MRNTGATITRVATIQ